MQHLALTCLSTRQVLHDLIPSNFHPSQGVVMFHHAADNPLKRQLLVLAGGLEASAPVSGRAPKAEVPDKAELRDIMASAALARQQRRQDEACPGDPARAEIDSYDSNQ